MGTPSYRYLFTDLLTDAAIDVLPMSGVSFDCRLNEPGALQGTIPVPNSGLGLRASKIIEGRTALWVYRDNEIWWGGIVWIYRTRKDGNGIIVADVQAATFESYLARRILRVDKTYTATDQFAIVRSLIDEMQITSNGNLGITYDTQNAGVVRDRVYSGTAAKSYGEIIQELSAVIGGFDFGIFPYEDANGVRVKRLRLGYPRLGQSVTPHPFSSPGPILAYTWHRDATIGGTSFQARGAALNVDGGQADEPLMSTIYPAQGYLDGGWPLLDITNDYSAVEVAATLNEHAQGDRVQQTGSVIIPDVTVRLIGSTLKPTNLGDHVAIKISDPWWPAGPDGSPALNKTYRLIGITVTAADRDTPETADLLLEAV